MRKLPAGCNPAGSDGVAAFVCLARLDIDDEAGWVLEDERAVAVVAVDSQADCHVALEVLDDARLSQARVVRLEVAGTAVGGVHVRNVEQELQAERTRQAGRLAAGCAQERGR